MGLFGKRKLSPDEVLERVRAVHPGACNFMADGDGYFTFNTGEDSYGVHSCATSVYGETCEMKGATRRACAEMLRNALELPGNSRTR